MEGQGIKRGNSIMKVVFHRFPKKPKVETRKLFSISISPSLPSVFSSSLQNVSLLPQSCRIGHFILLRLYATDPSSHKDSFKFPGESYWSSLSQVSSIVGPGWGPVQTRQAGTTPWESQGIEKGEGWILESYPPSHTTFLYEVQAFIRFRKFKPNWY